LRDYSLSAAVRAGEPLLIRLVWDATTTLDADYAAFTQLWDDQAHVIAQRDIRLQFMGRTSGGSSEIRSGLIIPPATRPGVYRLIAGVYDLRTGQRLPVSGADYITLRPIQIHISD
jgi:hypothetical protein